jgi:hypothetical protein
VGRARASIDQCSLRIPWQPTAKAVREKRTLGCVTDLQRSG